MANYDPLEDLSREANKLFEQFKRDWGLDPSPQPITPPKQVQQNSELLEQLRWQDIIRHPCVVLVIGRRGSGKSALGYKLLEYLRWNGQSYVAGLPQKAAKLLPDWIGTTPSLEDIPPKSICLIDESYIAYHARGSSSEKSRMLSTIVNLSRQRETTLIFISQEARQIDKNIASSADIIIVKNPSILQLEFERGELRKILEEAQREFAVIAEKDRVKWAYVYSHSSDHPGMISISLPSFWCSGLSKAYTDTASAPRTTTPRKLSKLEKIFKAHEFENKGYSLGQSAKALGVSKSTVYNWLHYYPYKK